MKRLNDLLREYPILLLPFVAVLVVTLSFHSSVYLHSGSDDSDSTLRTGIRSLFTSQVQVEKKIINTSSLGHFVHPIYSV